VNHTNAQNDSGAIAPWPLKHPLGFGGTMSTVLWANYLLNGAVVSDQSDKYALNKYLNKLDSISKEWGVPALSSICDSTDARFNTEDIELPPGMKSTNEVMARQGVWMEAEQALHLLQKVLEAIKSKNIKFGLLKNDHQSVVSELEESIAFARVAAEKKAKFNFCLVM
jgi:hypothetical protein